MFGILNLGSLIYILDKTDGIKLKIGTITSISSPRTNYNPALNMQNQLVVDIKCLIDGLTLEFNCIPSSYNIISYNNGKLVISETKQGLIQEVETTLLAALQTLNNIDSYKENIEDCERILAELNPLFAKDLERDNRLNSLELKFLNVESKLDTMLNIMNNKNYDGNRIN